MNDNLTYNSVVHNLSYKDKAESARQSIARGISTPDKLIIRSSPYTDSATKVAGNRYVVRFERHDIDANNQKIISSGHAVFQVPETVTQAQIDSLVATFKAGIADASLVAAVLNNEK